MPENTSGFAAPTPPDDRETKAVVTVDEDDSVPSDDHPTSDPSVSPARVARPGTPTDLPPEPQVQMAKINKAPDKIFAFLTAAAGFLIVAIVAFVGIFLVKTSYPSLAANQTNFFTSSEWTVTGGDKFAFGILKTLWTTVYISFLALLIAVPVAVGVALLLTQYLSPKVSRTVGFLVDLLAAVPSIIYGLWGLKMLGPVLLPVYKWLTQNLGFIPFFSKSTTSSAGNVATASLVLAIMILPIITALTRDVFEQTPRDHIEAALALGATKWEVIRTAVLPYGRSGMVAASMLGLGRALGETVAIMIILSTTKKTDIVLSLFQGGETFASKIAAASGEFDSAMKTGAYVAAGLVLFVVTFIVNSLARIVAESGKAKS